MRSKRAENVFNNVSAQYFGEPEFMRTSLDNDWRRLGIQTSLLRAAKPGRYSHHGGQLYNSARNSPLDNRSYDVWLSRLSWADWLRYLGRGRCAARSKIAPLKRDVCMPRHYGLNPLLIEVLPSFFIFPVIALFVQSPVNSFHSFPWSIQQNPLFQP